MTKYNPNIHHRKSIRLKNYDYSQAGLYFITICVQNRECLFGEIVGADLCVCPDTDADLRVCPNHNIKAKFQLNDAGKMIEKWYYELENKFPDIKCHQMVVMPNHFHCIIEIVGADLRVCPNDKTRVRPDTDTSTKYDQTNPIEGEHTGSPLHRVVQWFKTMTTNEYIRGVKNLKWEPFNGKLWQRNYWEHIIRNEKSYQTISEYITNNPEKWANDKFYTP